MAPSSPLPHCPSFPDTETYISSLLSFTAGNTLFQTLCGGIHILDFFTREPSLYHSVIPSEWRSWLLARDSMELLDFLMRDDLDRKRDDEPPESLVEYVRTIRRLSLRRDVARQDQTAAPAQLPRHVAVGMIPKKVHEVSHFADYVVRVAEEAAAVTGKEITHFVDFGSGQNYLGRTLASPPYNKHIIAVESKELNINGAKSMDVLARVAEREKVMRNKKLWRKQEDERTPVEKMKEKQRRRFARKTVYEEDENADFRPTRELEAIYTPEQGRGYVQYVEQRVTDGDLSAVVEKIERMNLATPQTFVNEDSASLKLNGNTPNSHQSGSDPTSPPFTTISSRSPSPPDEIRLMAISIHSCGNLSHHGIRSLILNPNVHAIAIVGCCYNLMSERLGPPSFKHPLMRQNQRAINAPRVEAEASSCDAHGFPMSERIARYRSASSSLSTSLPEAAAEGIRLNITARMMAVQAPQNWTSVESSGFFKRHFYRALLQRVFLDHGVVSLTTPVHTTTSSSSAADDDEIAIPPSTDPVIIGSLRKSAYGSFTSYVRGALAKLLGASPTSTTTTTTTASSSPSPKTNTNTNATTNAPTTTTLPPPLHSKLQHLSTHITDAELSSYETRYTQDIEGLKELSIAWSLMAFSAGVVESLIVVDRYLWLREQGKGKGEEQGEEQGNGGKKGEDGDKGDGKGEEEEEGEEESSVVIDAWVEPVWEYSLSPRNLVVVGIKR